MRQVRQLCASTLKKSILEINQLQTMSRQFESGHPDFKPASTVGLLKNKVAHFGALEWFDEQCSVFELGSETLNSKIREQMIKSVQIKDYDGNIARRWHVEYREQDPESKKWQRVRVYGGVNRAHDQITRTQLVNDLYHEVISQIHKKFDQDKKSNGFTFKRCCQIYINDKRNTLRKNSIKNMSGSLKVFQCFLVLKNLHDLNIKDINKHHIRDYRIWISKTMSNRSVNNHLDFLKMFFNYFIKYDDEIISKNPCTTIDKLPNTSETHIAYSDKEIADIFEYLHNNDQHLLLFCKFVGMGFVRCEEARHLKVRDIDFLKHTITLSGGNSKTRKRVVKPMLDIFYKELIRLGIDKYDGDSYVFSLACTPGRNPLHYNYFSKRFKKVKKQFNLSKKHTIYGFRHTFVCKMLANNAKWHEIMKYTGHTTMEAFSKYAKALLNQPAEDLSIYIDKTFNL